MKDSTQLLHELQMHILDVQIAAILEQQRHGMAAILEDDAELKAIHQSHAAAQQDIYNLCQNLLKTAKGERPVIEVEESDNIPIEDEEEERPAKYQRYDEHTDYAQDND